MPKFCENTDQQYWERILTDAGLSMERGLPPKRRVRGEHRTERVTVFVGGHKEIVAIDEQGYQKESGRVSPRGRGPDN